MSNLIINNVRFGFATNSSSTHSVIFNNNYAKFNDKDTGSFGWEFFTLVSSHSKKEYIFSLLMQNLHYKTDLPDSIIKIITQNWCEVNEVEVDGIDHQSIIMLPKDQKTNFMSKEFFDEFKKFILTDGIIICGGNDNTEYEHHLVGHTESKTIEIPMSFEDSSDVYCRYDDKYNFWTLFNKDNGNKVRFAFTENDIKNYTINKSSTPELVDIKITDFCTANCAYCYQNSTANGKHCKDDDIYKLANALSEMNVFEVAIGGGEPTSHPKFAGILYTFKHKNIIANFTTKSLDWLRDSEIRDSILSNIGSFAYSVNNEKQVRVLGEICNSIYMHHVIPTIHVVIGTVNDNTLREILETARFYEFSVTLLGFKTTGRGSEFLKNHSRSINSTDWLKVISELINDHNCPRIGIDTCLVQQYQKELEENNIPEYAYTVHEGKFSCYIDAVNNKMGPSSFCPENEMSDIEFNYNTLKNSIIDLYQTY